MLPGGGGVICATSLSHLEASRVCLRVGDWRSGAKAVMWGASHLVKVSRVIPEGGSPNATRHDWMSPRPAGLDWSHPLS